MSARSPFHSSRRPVTRSVVLLALLLLFLGMSLLLPLQADASSFPLIFKADSSRGQPTTCGDPSTPIHEIQGSGAVSPMVGETVVIEGIVVGDFQNNDQPDHGNLNGFYVQEADANTDDDELTSEGIFVFAPDAPDVSTGNAVRVSGTVGEQVTSSGASSMTRLASVTDVTVCATSVPLPELVDVTLPVSVRSDFERYEGMRVRFPQELVISEYFNFDRFGEIVLALPLPGQERLQQPTSVEEPGPGAAALAEINSLRRIMLDDGRTTQNPDPAIHPNGEVFTLENRFRGGDILANTIGVIDESFGVYRIQPTGWGEYSARNPRPEAPADVGGSLRVAAFNVLNYFTTIDEGQNNCGPSGDMECRGADTPEEFVRQRTKIIAALVEVDADIVGLMEIENNAVESVQDLVNGLNEEMGEGIYAFINTGTIGTDAIKLALIYKPATVAPVGDFALLTSAVDPRFDDSRNRPVLAQAFRELATEGVLTVAVNHLKSKGSACGEGDDDPLQGNCNGTRARAAAAMVDWLAADPTGSGDPDVLIIGDLNAYDKEDPIDILRAGVDGVEGTGDDYVDLVHQYLGELAYTYVFDGQVGYLDYALAISTLMPQVTGTTIWHINADEPDILDYDMSFKQPPQAALYEPNAYRSSDHDPVIVGLALTAEPTAVQMATLTANQRTTLPLVALTALLLVGTAAILVRRRR
jgi:uncharacterized protein